LQVKIPLVLQDAASYQQLLDQLDQLQALEGVRCGLPTSKQAAWRR